MARRSKLVGVCAVIALALAACGGSTTRSVSGHENSQLAMAQCMRAHGVTGFPDPTGGPGGGGFSISAVPGSATLTVDGTSFSGPIFTSAERTCRLFGGGNKPGPISEAQKQKLVEFARCMRAHGVSGFADPTFPPGGGVESGASGGVDINAPATRRAATTCNRIAGF